MEREAMGTATLDLTPELLLRLCHLAEPSFPLDAKVIGVQPSLERESTTIRLLIESSEFNDEME